MAQPVNTNDPTPELDLDAIRAQLDRGLTIAGYAALAKMLMPEIERLRAALTQLDAQELLRTEQLGNASEEIERLRGELIRATHGHTPGEGQCEKYRCAYCRYCGKEKPCPCTGTFTMQIPESGTDVPRKDFLDEDGLISAVSTIAMLDADGYETAVGLPVGGFMDTGQWHPVERYTTAEEAIAGHDRWLTLAPTLTQVTDLGNPSDPDSTPTVVDLVAELARLKEGN